MTGRMVVVGGGHAGAQAVASLRREGHEGEILLLSSDRYLPYYRPALSKEYLTGEQSRDRIWLRPERFYADQRITLRLATAVTAIERDVGRVVTDAGERIDYDRLLLCTGSRPRRLAVDGGELAGIHYLRGLADADAIREELTPGSRLVVVGGGYIGLEVASVAVQAGLEVCVVEMEERILQRVATRELSSFYERLHRGHGVVIRTAAAVAGFESDGAGRVRGVMLTTGERLPADLVVVGVGITPVTELAESAGLHCDDGIRVDQHCRTEDPRIFAAGDCTNHPNPLLGRRLRLESVPNATDQARAAAANILGRDSAYATIPWFWSDQYDVKLQIVGFAADGEERVMRGELGDEQCIVFHLRKGAVVAAELINSARALGVCRKLVAARREVARERLADPSVPFASLIE